MKIRGGMCSWRKELVVNPCRVVRDTLFLPVSVNKFLSVQQVILGSAVVQIGLGWHW